MEDSQIREGYFCHECLKEVRVKLDAVEHEYACLECDGQAVEAPNQNYEDFIMGQNTNIDSDEEYLGAVIDREAGTVGSVQNLVRRVLAAEGEESLLTSTAAAQTEASTGGVPDMLLRRARAGISHESIFEILSSLVGGTAQAQADDDGGNIDDVLHAILMNETSHANTPATPEAVANLTRSIILEDTPDETRKDLGECGITQEEFVVGDTAVTLPCGHNYKEESILQWLSTSNTCPSCRHVVG
jgi:hypothetical protein